MMKIEIRDTDHARLVALAEARGEADVSQVVRDALTAYFDLQEGRAARRDPGALRRELATDGFEALLDRLADEFEAMAGPDVAPLPDEAFSRAGIYRDHP